MELPRGQTMPFKDEEAKKAHDKAYGASWYQRNKERVKAASNARKARLRDEWLHFKSTLSCSDCGASHPAIIDFHHDVQEDKEHNIHTLVANSANKKVLEEMKKCTILCANCHRIRHFNEHRAEKAVKLAKEQDT
jgi:acetylornithine/succinyldiaminopimelate/putrescine aminotransferase